MHSKKKNRISYAHKKKDTCNIIEKIFILEISLLANLIDSFQKKVLSPRPLLLKQNNHVSQGHVVPAVCEGSELQDRGCADIEGRGITGSRRNPEYHV